MKRYPLLIIILAALLALTACSTPAANNAEVSPDEQATANAATAAALTAEAAPEVIQVDAATGETSFDSLALETAMAPLGTGELTVEEAAGLLLMREEEKLAHDVYLVLYEHWGLNIFQNIANSEQSHTDAVKALLDRYGLNDPAAGKAAGEFTDPTLQGLYDQLVAQGSLSLADALKVGAAIEEIDIIDLQEEAALTTRADILLVYQNLETGSRNHLRSFARNLLNQTGEVYQPQYLTPEAYQAIISTAIETGGGGGGGGKP